MHLLFIRHGDPDYEHDSLTEKGRKEAALLADRISKLDVKEFFTSPLGRAHETADLAMEKTGRKAEILDWTQEFFQAKILRPDKEEGERDIVWDWLPEDWTRCPEFYLPDKWKDNPIMQEAHVGEIYDEVCGELDNFLERRGYVRDGNTYRVEKPNRDTFVFFAHFGVTCVFLSHLLNVSPMPLWHGMCAAPTSVTSLFSEERRQGIAIFRANTFGDISHLYVAGEEPSFHARFRETYDSDFERKD